MSEVGASVRLSDAPEPDDERKPSAPWRLRAATWRYIARKVVREFSEDNCTDSAASLTYYAVLSLFPGLIALVSIIGFFGDAEAATGAIMRVIERLAPESVTETLDGVVGAIASSPSAGFGFVLGLLGAIWFASRYVGAFGRVLNTVYDIDEGRPFWILKPLNLLVTVVMLACVLGMLILLLISGPVADAIGDAFGLGDTVRSVWNVGKWPVLALLVAATVSVLYYGTPNVRQPRLRWIAVGALLAIGLLAAATVGFTLYVRHFADYDRFYGPLAGIVVFLLWLWIANLALLLGAEVDAEMERGRQLQGGIAAEEHIQLPPRSTRQSGKSLDRQSDDIERGRALRRGNS